MIEPITFLAVPLVVAGVRAGKQRRAQARVQLAEHARYVAAKAQLHNQVKTAARSVFRELDERRPY